MASRLSEESLSGVYEVGYRGLPRAKKPMGFNTVISTSPLSALLAQENPFEAVAALAPQHLYLQLQEAGLENSLDVLPYLSDEQFVRMMDYDVWSEEGLLPKQALYWLSLYRDLEPKQMYDRFRSLDEEYQIAILSPFVRVFDPEEFEKLSEEEQDRIYRFPRDSFFYAILSDEKEIHKGIDDLVNVCMSEDMAFAMKLLLHSAHTLTAEVENQISQFRKARMEEDGFVSYDDSLALFAPIDHESLKQRYAAPQQDGVQAPQLGAGVSFIQQVLASCQEQG